MNKIAIIGAGWVGLGCLRKLRDEGHQVDLFEQKNDVGGTWHPDAFRRFGAHRAARGSGGDAARTGLG